MSQLEVNECNTVKVRNCQAQPKIKLGKKFTNTSEPEISELELMFLRIKDYKSIRNTEKNSPKVKIMSQNRPLSQKIRSNESPSINRLLKCNQNNSHIKKEEQSKVRKLILELEKPTILSQKGITESTSESKSKKRVYQKTVSVLTGQAKITKFFDKNTEKD